MSAMSERRFQTLERMLHEQQAEIDVLSDLCIYISQAQVAMRKNQMSMQVRFDALCGCLRKQGLVSQMELVLGPLTSSWRPMQVHLFSRLFEEPRAWHGIMAAAGIVSMGRVCMTSLSCMKSVVNSVVNRCPPTHCTRSWKGHAKEEAGAHLQVAVEDSEDIEAVEAIEATEAEAEAPAASETPSATDAAGVDCLQLLQDCWQYHMLADALASAMGMETVSQFCMVSRGGRECMRGFSALNPAAANLSAAEPSFERNQLVVVSGLKTRPDLNGMSARLLHYAAFSKRWHILLSNGESMRVRSSNIQHMREQHIREREYSPPERSRPPQPPITVDWSAWASQMEPQDLLVSREWLYVCGGCDHLSALQDVQRLNPITGGWEDLPPLSAPRFHVAATVAGGSIYVCGGFSGERVLRSVERFEPTRKAWYDAPPMLRPRLSACIAAVDDVVYVCGGCNANILPVKHTGRHVMTSCCSAERLRHGEPAWQLLPQMSEARAWCTGTRVRQAVVVCGGIGTDGASCTAEQFFPITGRWGPLLPMIGGARNFPATANDGLRLYVCGGLGPGANAPMRAVERLNVDVGRWEQLQPLRHARVAAIAEHVGAGRVCVAGGSLGLKALDLTSVELYCPRMASWVELRPLGHPRSFAMARATSGYLYVMGGFHGNQVLASIERLPLTEGLESDWELMPNMLRPQNTDFPLDTFGTRERSFGFALMTAGVVLF